MIPNQVEIATTSRTLTRTTAVADLPSALASICAKAADERIPGVDLAEPIRIYLSEYGEPNAFNCVMLDQSDSAEIHLYLICLAVVDHGNADGLAVTSTLLSASLNLSNKHTQSTIAQVFGGFTPPERLTLLPAHCAVIRNQTAHSTERSTPMILQPRTDDLMVEEIARNAQRGATCLWQATQVFDFRVPDLGVTENLFISARSRRARRSAYWVARIRLLLKCASSQ
ncbi:hypothetical protein [Sinorhizobium psoraleae]|uniref:hypothetical protein n=1 Tax=Sinorhizobium psoraleae TaxID=520838 RepID=UPI001FE7847D|nr:hypothetical protein [Sinorhizobium psoraleae]